MSEEFLTKVPHSAIMALCHNTGRKWEKRLGLCAVGGSAPRRGADPYCGAMGVCNYDKDANPIIEAGNLPEGDYRFWIGMRDPALSWSKCRLCDQVCHSAKERKKHHHERNCSTKLLKVYSMCATQAVVRCMSCGQQTTKSRWGVPLCQLGTCWRGWKFDMFYNHLNNAKEIAKRRGLITDWEEDDDSN